MSMGDASSIPQSPVDPNAMGENPSMGGEDPNAMDRGPSMGGEDPNAMEGDPLMGGEDPNAMGEEDDDSTMSIINQLSDTDREAVRSYAESMLSRDETQNNGDGSMPEQPMMERVIFTKKQIREINENFGPNQDEIDKKSDERKPLTNKKNNKISLKSPFNSPKFK